jgi:hypothetical protein
MTEMKIRVMWDLTDGDGRVDVQEQSSQCKMQGYRTEQVRGQSRVECGLHRRLDVYLHRFALPLAQT